MLIILKLLPALQLSGDYLTGTLHQLHSLVRSQPATTPPEPPGTTEAVGPPCTRPAQLICRAEADRAGLAAPVMVRTSRISQVSGHGLEMGHSLTHLLTHLLIITHFLTH